MAQPKPPVPKPRTFPMGKAEDAKPLSRWSYAGLPPSAPPEPGVVCSGPPVAPKKWSVKRSSGGCDAVNSSLEIVKISDRGEDKLQSPCPKYASEGLQTTESTWTARGNHLPSVPHLIAIYHGANEVVGHPIYETIVTEEKTHQVSARQSVYENCESRPPPLPTRLSAKSKPDNKDQNEILDPKYLMGWWKNVKPWSYVSQDLKLKEEEEAEVITVKAQWIYNAIQLYILLLMKHGATMKDHIADLFSIADNLDKVSKGTKIAGITGGATGVVGGVAAAAGVLLTPFTMGASLALTAVGVGVAAAGGVTGASAAIAHKVNITQDKKKIENTFQEYKALMVEIQDCLKFINEGMEQLRQHDLQTLSRVGKGTLRVARVVELAAGGQASARAIEANSKASGLMHGFALGMDFYFTQKKDGPKLKKGLGSKFAEKIREVTVEMEKGLDELMQTKELFSRYSLEEK